MTSDKAHITLADTQKWMQYLLLSQGHVLPQHQQHLIPAGDVPAVTAIVKGSQRLSAGEHLAIYQRSYTARLRACMSAQFSALEHALGAPLFRAFADEYLQHHPSRHYNLITLGEQFPAFLEAGRPDKDAAVKEDWPDFIIELARFEYAINIIFEEQDEAYTTPALHTTPEALLQLVPLLYVFECKYPIRQYYHAFVNNLAPALPLAKQSYCVVMRHDYKLNMYDINKGQYLLLHHLVNGLTVLEAKQKLSTENIVQAEQLDAYWSLWKKKWIDKGFFMIRPNNTAE